MRLSEFNYELPAECIAQEPQEQRDRSRLMVVPRARGSFEHRRFFEFVRLLRSDDLLVLNDTHVIPAKLRGHKTTGGKVEILLDRPLGSPWAEDGMTCQRFACLLQASRPLAQGGRVVLPAGGEAVRDGSTPTNQPRLLLRLPTPLADYLDAYGEVPLPAYIKRRPGEDPRLELDRARYQTVYAKRPGAVAAPTAGFHFTVEALDEIRARGVRVVFITLHVGPGTFLPVRTEEVDRHRMHPERFCIEPETAAAVTEARSTERRVVAVGTTVVRTLEAAWTGTSLSAGEGETSLFIRPGYAFRAVDALLTNFHLPRSTLFMLACAFSSTERLRAAYREAIDNGYRFYSYGDAMFLS